MFKMEAINLKGLNEIWAGDITYVAFKDKFLFLVVVIDWSIIETLETKGVLDVLIMAFIRELNPDEILFFRTEA